MVNIGLTSVHGNSLVNGFLIDAACASANAGRAGLEAIAARRGQHIILLTMLAQLLRH